MSHVPKTSCCIYLCVLELNCWRSQLPTFIYQNSLHRELENERDATVQCVYRSTASKQNIPLSNTWQAPYVTFLLSLRHALPPPKSTLVTPFCHNIFRPVFLRRIFRLFTREKRERDFFEKH